MRRSPHKWLPLLFAMALIAGGISITAGLAAASPGCDGKAAQPASCRTDDAQPGKKEPHCADEETEDAPVTGDESDGDRTIDDEKPTDDKTTTTEDPTTDSTTDDPTIDSTTDDPSTDDPTTDDANTDSTTDDPTTDDPTTEDEPSGDGPAPDDESGTGDDGNGRPTGDESPEACASDDQQESVPADECLDTGTPGGRIVSIDPKADDGRPGQVEPAGPARAGLAADAGQAGRSGPGGSAPDHRSDGDGSAGAAC